jgi:hypothetical protein
MANHLKLIIGTIVAAISIYLISLIEEKNIQLILGCLLLIASLIFLMYQRKGE